jgi:glycosyltransferase involved in cell wall biosynthesis
MLSLIVPVYKNEESLDRLLQELVGLNASTPGGLEVVFVIDGSPDGCYQILERRLPALGLTARLLSLSRNYGSFAAIAAGLAAGRGDYFAVKAADLQEPPELILDFLRILESGDADVVFGCRTERSDPWLSGLSSRAFWWIYRTLVVREMPPGGVDVFGCTRDVRDHVLGFREINSNLIVLLFWLGFRRRFVNYKRARRLEGKSAWTFTRKLHYCIDSIFSFTDVPVQWLMYFGLLAMGFSLVFRAIHLFDWGGGVFQASGYAPIVLTLIFFGGLTSLGLGIVGRYAWLALQNSRGRPIFVVASQREFAGTREIGGIAPHREETEETRPQAASQ